MIYLKQFRMLLQDFLTIQSPQNEDLLPTELISGILHFTETGPHYNVLITFL